MLQTDNFQISRMKIDKIKYLTHQLESFRKSEYQEYH